MAHGENYTSLSTCKRSRIEEQIPPSVFDLVRLRIDSLIYAGTCITDMTTATGADHNANMKREYVCILKDIPNKIFESRALKTAMLPNMHGSGQDPKGSQLWTLVFIYTAKEVLNSEVALFPLSFAICYC